MTAQFVGPDRQLDARDGVKMVVDGTTAPLKQDHLAAPALWKSLAIAAHWYERTAW